MINKKGYKQLFYQLILSSLVIFISSCATLDPRVAPGFREAFSSVGKAVFGYPDNVITPELVESIPYASMKLKIGKGPAGLIILQKSMEKRSFWVSADKVLLVIQDGKLLRTEGLHHNLKSHLTGKPSFQSLLTNNTSKVDYYDYYSYDQPELHNLRTEVNLTLLGRKEINILNEKRNTYLYLEEITNEFLGWKVKNYYWVDGKDGFVWKSIQSPSPKLPSFSIEVTKKPAK